MKKSKRIFIIAEAGVNHNGSLNIARKLIGAAARADADAVKFQTFNAVDMATRYAEKAEYQKRTTDISISHLVMLKRLELSEASHRELIAYCGMSGIRFLSSPFDMKGIDMLRRLGLGMFKVPSGEITNLPYLKMLGGLKKKIILSTGMSELGEIRDAISILVKSGTPKKNISLLHCNTEYPTPFRDANLKAIATLRKRFGVSVGYSDHTTGIEAPVAAVALGAEIIEKHMTLDRRMKGPDHAASLEPGEFGSMVRAIRNIEIALGDGIKRAMPSEMKNRGIARKSIVALKKIGMGEYFDGKNITVKRPGSGISPMEWDKVIGKRARHDFAKDELIEV